MEKIIYHMERVDRLNGEIVYEIHGANNDPDDFTDSSFIVFHGPRAKQEAERCLRALSDRQTDTQTLEAKILALPPKYPSVGHQYVCGYNDGKSDAANLIRAAISA